MGCVSSVFQFGSYLVQEGADVNEEQKDESSTDKDGVQVPSSPSQDTVLRGAKPVESRRRSKGLWAKVSSAFFLLRVTSTCFLLLSSLIHLSVSCSVVLSLLLLLLVTVASSGNEKVQESPAKTEAPLAREEESYIQQASPVAEATKEGAKQESEAKTKDAEAPEPEVKELQRVNETKLEKEKTVDNSGVTTEKTVYTQISESVTVQESKGPAIDPFASSQKTVFPPFSKSWHESKPQATESQSPPSYVHSVKVTESSYPAPSSPVLVSSDETSEKTQSVRQISESVSENIVPVPEKVEISEKTEVVEIVTDAAESLNGSHAEQLQSGKVTAPLPEDQQVELEQETPSSEAQVVYEEQAPGDNERSEVEGAVVKIQAGIRGYLTRKSLKESRKDGPMVQSPKGGASVQLSKEEEAPVDSKEESPPPESKEGEAPVKSKEEEAPVESKEEEAPVESKEEALVELKEDEAPLESKEEILVELKEDETPLESKEGQAHLESKENEVLLSDPVVSNAEEAESAADCGVTEESDAAVKIQAMYRGYRTRRQLDELLNEPCDGEVEALDISAEEAVNIVQENRRSPPDRSPVTVTENFVPILKAQVTITPPSSPTIKKEHNISSSVEVTPEDSKTSEIPEKSGDVVEAADTHIPTEEDDDEEGKKQAATKIQAAFRGYKVRKISRKEASGNVEEIEDTTEDVLISDDNVEIKHESNQVLRGTPSPPLEQDNDDDTLEDNTADDVEEIPDVQWQTSELYTDDTSPKHMQEESKTESILEKPTAPSADSSKTTHISSEQIILSTTRISPEESQWSAMSTAVEDQQVQSDH